MDAWQRPLEDVGAKGKDQGRGAKYLIVPPGYQGPYPHGYITLQQQTFNGYTLMRPIIADSSDENLKKAAAFVKTIKVYPYSRAKNPPKTRFIDIYDKDIDGITEFDASFYERLNMMVQEEPIESKDLAMMGLLKAIGIEKGVPYAPDAKRKRFSMPPVRKRMGTCSTSTSTASSRRSTASRSGRAPFRREAFRRGSTGIFLAISMLMGEGRSTTPCTPA